MLLETHDLSLLPRLSFRLLARHPRNVAEPKMSVDLEQLPREVPVIRWDRIVIDVVEVVSVLIENYDAE